MSASDRGSGLQRYLDQSSDLVNSLILVLPLLLIYEAGLLFSGGATLNGVDFVTVFLARQWGTTGLLVFNGLLFVAGLVGLKLLERKRRFDPRIIVPVAVESTVYALLLGVVIATFMRQVLGMAAGPEGYGVLDRVFLSLGAGVNEELVFRLGLYSGLAWVLRKGMSDAAAVASAAVISSILFSLAHYVGPSESFALHSFVYRFLAGGLFCALYCWRGFAVAVYTHAIYDIYVLVYIELIVGRG